MKRKIFYLTGFMASGKSTIGPILANTLGWNYYDLDSEIERREDSKIANIFKTRGEEYFRKLETSVLKELSNINRAIISLGGGTIISKENFNIIKASGKIIYLKYSSDIAYERLKNKIDRPLLTQDEDGTLDNLKNKIDTLMAQRKKFYEKADFTVQTDVNNLGITVDTIARYIEKSILHTSDK